MKRKIASRKLKNCCIYCNKSFLKGEIYYKKRIVEKDYDGEIFAYEYLVCPKCKYKNETHLERFKKFQESNKCSHVKVRDVWTLIFGETYAKEPSHTECLICKKII